MTKPQIIVIGGGAAGLMAAGQVAESGGSVLILEKMPRPGTKLRITGKGRCNLTNIAPLADFVAHFGRNGNYLRKIFSRFFTPELIEFFNQIGVNTITERGGRVFPASEQARDVVDAIVRWATNNGLVIQAKSSVSKLLIEKDRIVGVQTSDRIYKADAVIIATGGASYPATGSSGDGYKLAESVGHSIIPTRPALVPVETAGNIAGRLEGLSLRNVKARVIIDNRKKAEAFGDMTFTDFGLTGPIILTLSRDIVDALGENRQVTVSIDLKSALNDKILDARLLRDFEANPKKQFRTILKQLLPASLIPVCIDLTGVNADKTGNQISAEERKRLRLWLKDFRFDVIGHRPFAEAIITAGGVNLKEIDLRTMASRLVRGLYFAGEVLDIDGDTGGYNLQAAFSTGWLAGRSATVKKEK